MSKTVGIIGGMGPSSTIELMSKIVAMTPVKREQDHIRMLVDNRPEIPDRTEFILKKGPSPVPMLVESAQLLENSGCDVLAIACNTAHLFIDSIQAAVGIPVLNMLKLLEEDLKAKFSETESFVLLATTGSIQSKLFQKFLPDFTLLIPAASDQNDRVMSSIYGENGVKIKGVNDKNLYHISQVLQLFEKDHPAAVIAGCTEIAMILQKLDVRVPVFNPLNILARRIVEVVKFGPEII